MIASVTLTITVPLNLSPAASAASVVLCQCAKPGGATAYGLFIDASGVGPANSVHVTIVPSSTFLNYDADGAVGSPPDLELLRPGSDHTFTNAELTLPEVFGGYGFTLADAPPTDGPAGISYTIGLLGADRFIDTSEPIFLNNLVVPPGGAFTGTVQLNLAGNQVFSSAIFIPLTEIARCPEPGGLILASIALASAGQFRRRRLLNQKGTTR